MPYRKLLQASAVVLSEQVLWWVVSSLNADVEVKREEREEAGCKLTASLHTRTKKLCKRDK